MTIRMYEGILRNRKKLLKELGILQGPDRRETERRLIEAGYYIYRCVEEPKEKYVPYCSCSMVIDQEEGMRFFQNWKEYPFEKLVAEISGKIQDADRLSRMIGVDSSLWLEGDILFGVGRLARASGIDLLLPFVDRRMFELSAVIPSTLKRKNGIAKIYPAESSAAQDPP